MDAAQHRTPARVNGAAYGLAFRGADVFIMSRRRLPGEGQQHWLGVRALADMLAAGFQGAAP
jgi:hypothetical protein